MIIWILNVYCLYSDVEFEDKLDEINKKHGLEKDYYLNKYMKNEANAQDLEEEIFAEKALMDKLKHLNLLSNEINSSSLKNDPLYKPKAVESLKKMMEKKIKEAENLYENPNEINLSFPIKPSAHEFGYGKRFPLYLKKYVHIHKRDPDHFEHFHEHSNIEDSHFHTTHCTPHDIHYFPTFNGGYHPHDFAHHKHSMIELGVKGSECSISHHVFDEHPNEIPQENPSEFHQTIYSKSFKNLPRFH